jgi:hypothetical protein
MGFWCAPFALHLSKVNVLKLSDTERNILYELGQRGVRSARYSHSVRKAFWRIYAIVEAHTYRICRCRSCHASGTGDSNWENNAVQYARRRALRTVLFCKKYRNYFDHFQRMLDGRGFVHLLNRALPASDATN